MSEPNGPGGPAGESPGGRAGESEGLEELPEKGPDAARQFAELLEQARRLQRERGFSSKGHSESGEGEEQGGSEQPGG